MEYLPDILYNTSTLTKKTCRRLFREAKELSYNWWVDDKPTWSRRKIDMDFEKVMRLFIRTQRKYLHITVIHRMSCCKAEKEHLEIGFCTMNRKSPNGNIYLWIEVNLEYEDYLLKKYNLVEKL